MNKALRISISFLLSIIILVSGSGLIIGKMVCLKSGYSVLSVKEAKDCCEIESSGTKINCQCCDISNLTFQRNNFVPQSNLSLNPLFASAAILFSELSIPNYDYSFSANQNIQIPDPPLLICGSSSLPLLGIFRI